jgi:hypothetical protein
MLKIWKKSWEPFRSCLLDSTANPAHFHPNWAGLAVLFSRQILNGSQDFFHIFSIIFIYFFKYETIETHARAFLALIISAVASVNPVVAISQSLKGKYHIWDIYVLGLKTKFFCRKNNQFHFPIDTNTPNAPKLISPICLSKPKSLVN